MGEIILFDILKEILTPVLTKLIKKALAGDSSSTNQARNVTYMTTRSNIIKLVEEGKGVLYKGNSNGLDFKKLENLVHKLTEAEIYGDMISYSIKHNFGGNIGWPDNIENKVKELLETLENLIKELSRKPSNGLQMEPSGEPPGNVRRCLLYLSRFPKGYVFNRKRISRFSVAHEFIAADSSEPPLHQLTKWLKVAESNWDGNGAPYHFLIGNNVGQWPESHYFVCDALAESIESIGDNMFLSSLIYLGERNYTLKLEGGQFFLLKILSLRYGRLDSVKYLKTLSSLKYLDLKHADVEDCSSWLGGLEELEMLDLRYTRVEKIPDECLEKLTKLQHLLLGYRPNDSDNRLTGAELNTQKLQTKNLKTLRAIRRPEEMDENDNVHRVADLSMTGLKTNNLKEFWVAMEKFENLTSLGVAMTHDSVITLQDCGDKLKKNLKRLQMEGQFSDCSTSAQPHSRLSKLCEFQKLVDLTLVSHKAIEINSIPPLKILLCLRLYGFCKGTTLDFDVKGFEKLKKLVIGDMEKVEKVQIGTAVIEALHTLKLCNLPLFRELVDLDSQPQHFLLRFSDKPTKLPLKKVKSLKAIFLRDLPIGDFETSPGLDIYHYDRNKQCYIKKSRDNQ